jgi:O-antigen ligase
MKRFIKFSELGFTVLALLHYSQGIVPLLITNGLSEGDAVDVNSFDYTLNLLLFLMIYIITFSLLVARWKKVIYLLSKDRFIWVLVGIAVLSFFWSDAPTKTLTSCIGLIGTTLFGLYLATRYTLKEQLQLLACMYGLAIVLSILFAVLLPKYGIMGGVHAGAFRGIYTHKNTFGKVMVPGGIVFCLLALSATHKRLLLWCAFSFTLLLLVLAKSTTALSNFAIMLASLFIYRTFRLRYDRMVPAFFALTTFGGIFFLWFTANADAVLGSFGKDATLTGRTDMWPFSMEMIEKRPWLGYGYSAFWNGIESASTYIIRAMRWPVPNSHNGLLDLWLDVGALGVVTFVLGFWANLLKSIARIRMSHALENFWPILCMTYMVLSNITESSLMLQNDIIWVLYVSVVLSLLVPLEVDSKVM